MRFLIFRHSSTLWCLELCIGHCGPPSSVLKSYCDRLLPHRPRPPPAIVAAAVAVGAPTSGMLLPPAFFFVLFLFFAVALSSGIGFRLAGLPCLWGSLGMPCIPFYSPGAFVCQAEELRDVLHIVCG
jgi:hypothetical protein